MSKTSSIAGGKEARKFKVGEGATLSCSDMEELSA